MFGCKQQIASENTSNMTTEGTAKELEAAINREQSELINYPIKDMQINDMLELEETYINNKAESVLGYEVYLDNFSNAEDIVLEIEKLWVEIYGEEQIKLQLPYTIYHDVENEIWFITGTLEEGAIGGTAYAFVDGNSGKVLYVGHGQ